MASPVTPRRIPPGIAAMSDDDLAAFLELAEVDSTVSAAARDRAREHALASAEQRGWFGTR